MFSTMPKNILILKRKVKYWRLELSFEGLKIILPKKGELNLQEVLERHQKWIKKKRKVLKEIERLESKVRLFNHLNLNEKVNQLIEEKKDMFKIKPEAVSFRRMKKRWASCTKDNRLIFNKNLKFLPDYLIDYIVTHEMCHLWVKNHKKEFWSLLKKFYNEPTIKKFEKILSAYLRYFNSQKLGREVGNSFKDKVAKIKF